MKLSICFLIALFLAVHSNSQRFEETYNNPLLWRVPSNRYYINYPLYYEAFADNHAMESGDNFYYYTNKETDVGQRRLVPIRQRLFFNLFNPLGSNGLFGSLFQSSASSSMSQSTSSSCPPSTITSILTITVRATSLVVSSCIAIGDFKAADLAKVTCRKKRDSPRELFNQDFDLHAEPHLQPAPSSVEKIEPTAFPGSVEGSKRVIFDLASPSNEEIVSSKEYLTSEISAPRPYRQTAAITRTISVTQYNFVTSTSYETKMVGSDLQCMPSGFIVCPAPRNV